jgi:hypothetical protein
MVLEETSEINKAWLTKVICWYWLRLSDQHHIQVSHNCHVSKGTTYCSVSSQSRSILSLTVRARLHAAFLFQRGIHFYLKLRLGNSVSILTILEAGRPGFVSWQNRIFLFAVTSRLLLGPTQSPNHWVQGLLSRGVKRGGVNVTLFLLLIPMSRMREAVPPLSHMSAWRHT